MCNFCFDSCKNPICEKCLIEFERLKKNVVYPSNVVDVLLEYKYWHFKPTKRIGAIYDVLNFEVFEYDQTPQGVLKSIKTIVGGNYNNEMCLHTLVLKTNDNVYHVVNIYDLDKNVLVKWSHNICNNLKDCEMYILKTPQSLENICRDYLEITERNKEIPTIFQI